MASLLRRVVDHLNKLSKKKKIHPSKPLKPSKMEENFIPIDMEDYEDENLYEVVSIENGKLDLFNCSLVDNLENDSINNVICSETKSIEQQKELCANLRLRYLFAEARFMQKEEELRSLEQTRFEAALEGRFTADESLMMHNTNQQLEQQVKDLNCKRRQLRNKFLFEHEKYIHSCQTLDTLKQAVTQH